MSAKSTGRRALLDRLIEKYRPRHWVARCTYNQLIDGVRTNSSLLSPRSFRGRSHNEKSQSTEGYIWAISRMAQFHQPMVRSSYPWKPTGHPIHSLSKHLFGRFEFPAFLNRAWFGRIEEIQLLLDVARGINPRKAIAKSGLDWRLTRKASHFFATAPDRFGIDDTSRWAQLRALGARDQIAIRIVKACQGFGYEESFWQELARFLFRASEVEPGNRQLGVMTPDERELKEIASFVWQHKYLPASRVLGYRVHNDAPLQADFSLAGRTLGSLRRHMRNWRREIEIPTSAPSFRFSTRNRVWQPSGLSPLSVTDGGVTWETVEILETAELQIEGSLMQHCVGGYTRRCVLERSSIWSLRRSVEDSSQRVVTIEVRPQGRRIVQAKAKRNTNPTEHSMSLIRRWAIENDLKME